jgi:hypothetical protein
MAKEDLGLARRALDSSRPPRGAKRGHPRATRPRTRPPGSAPPTRGPRRRRRRRGVPDRLLSDQPPRSGRRGGRGRIGRAGCVVSRAPPRLGKWNGDRRPHPQRARVSEKSLCSYSSAMPEPITPSAGMSSLADLRPLASGYVSGLRRGRRESRCVLKVSRLPFLPSRSPGPRIGGRRGLPRELSTLSAQTTPSGQAPTVRR